MCGFQLWVNLLVCDKMIDLKYQEFVFECILVVQLVDGVQVKVIVGQVGDVIGLIVQLVIDLVYLDIIFGVGVGWLYDLLDGYSVFVYVFEGGLMVGQGEDVWLVVCQELVVFGGGECLDFQVGVDGVWLILVVGWLLCELVMCYGLFVMNICQELMQVFVDFQEGCF